MDELTEKDKHELKKEQVSSYRTLNEIRKEDDLPALPYGDAPLNPTYVQYMQAMKESEKADEAAQQGQAQGVQPGQPQGQQASQPGQPPQANQDKPAQNNTYIPKYSF